MTLNFETETEEKLNLDLDEKALAERVIEAALDYADFPYEAEVSLLLTNNEGIHEINREQRKIDAPTDVLSFPMAVYSKPGDFSVWEEESFDLFDPDTGEAVLGDIVISVEKVKEQAAAFGHSETREYAFLIAHSMLHLFGYDHMTDEDRLVMEQKQEELMNLLGISR